MNVGRLQLSSGRCTADRLAQQLGRDRRTLHRRLAGESTTFDAILNDVRTELAVRLLQNRDANLSATADMLGFSSDSAFSRWFRTRFRTSASTWRGVQSLGRRVCLRRRGRWKRRGGQLLVSVR